MHKGQSDDEAKDIANMHKHLIVNERDPGKQNAPCLAYVRTEVWGVCLYIHSTTLERGVNARVWKSLQGSCNVAAKWASGGIGIRACLRSMFRKECGFDPHLAHQ